jgi:aspartate aminotransferase
MFIIFLKNYLPNLKFAIMPKISNKGNLMPASPIRKLAPYAEAAKKMGIKIYHLNIGQPDVVTPPEFWTAVKNIEKEILEYSPSNGYESLRGKYCWYFNEKYNLKNLNKDDILITTGASEALFFTLLSILDEGEEIIIPEPLYANYIGFSRSGNIVLKPIATSIDNGFALPSIADFEKAISSKTKAILICNPNNPTGYTYSLQELETLKAIALKHDLFIISDEVYREFIYNNTPHISMLSFPELEQQVILIDSISKRFSACGARIGMVATKNKEVLATILKFAQQRLSPPSIEQLGAIALFDVKDDYFETVNIEYKKRRDTLVTALQKIEGVRCPNPGGAFYCMVQLPVNDAEDFCKWILSDFSYNGATVMMAPGNGFYATPDKGKDEVRIAYVLNCEAIEKAVECLKFGLEKYKELHE